MRFPPEAVRGAPRFDHELRGADRQQLHHRQSRRPLISDFSPRDDARLVTSNTHNRPPPSQSEDERRSNNSSSTSGANLMSTGHKPRDLVPRGVTRYELARRNTDSSFGLDHD